MRQRYITLLCTLSLSVLACRGSAKAAELDPFEASYTWVWHGMTVAVSTLELERNDDTWIYRSKSAPRGIGRMFSERPAQESVLRVTAAGTQPLSYRADDGTPSTKRDVDVRFDWLHGHVTGIYEDTPIDIPTRAGLQDDLSVQIALMVDLLRGHPPGKVLLLDKNAVREYSYTREGEETLDTPLGRIPTIIYQSHKQNSPRVTLFWCAPGQGYIPLQVEQRRLGDVQWTMHIQRLKRD
jgi:hypothetical protein